LTILLRGRRRRGPARHINVAAALLPRQRSVPLTLTPGGGRTMTTWRAELPSMLSWMTLRLASPALPAHPAKTSILAAGGRPARISVSARNP
jgi:hypothetical protein